MASRTITLEITLEGHLLVAGGQALDLGVDLATIRRLHEGREAPYIPATALRGAVRIQLEALLAGAGEEATGPYPLDPPQEEPSGEPTRTAEGFSDPVARLFGFSGRSGERSGSREGALRFSDALPVDPERVAAAFGIRPGVELDDHTASAEEGKLFFRQVVDVSREPLVFCARLNIDPSRLEEDGLSPEEIARLLGHLRTAVETTEAIGAGKAKGGGGVRISWREEAEDRAAATTSGDPASATRARLLLTLQEPAHFGDGGPHGNHHATRLFIPGATVRGAIAWALLRARKTTPEEEGFKALFLEGPPASFGDALLVYVPDVEPLLQPATGRESRVSKEIKDVLVTELARDRVNGLLQGSGLHLRAHDGGDRLDPIPARPTSGLVRRTRTRVSIDRWTGTAAGRRLFSIEQIEPWLVKKHETEEPRPVRFVSWVEGLNPASAALLANVKGLPVLVGAGRQHGLGLVQVNVCFEGEPATGASLETIRELARRVDRETAELAALAGHPAPEAASALPVALVALSDYVPTDPGAPDPHPLAELGISEPPSPSRRFVHPGASGGYDQQPGKAPLKDLIPAIGAGSVFVYEVAEDGLERLGRFLPMLRKGVGQRTESGCGRFATFDPSWPVQTKETSMSGKLESTIKSELVERAEKILNPHRGKWDFKDATAQLRNMVQITQEETEVAVLVNFINYQRGRDSTKKFWSLIDQPTIETLNWIKDNQSLDENSRKTAIRNFFGYLVRHYVYLEAIRKEEEEKRRREQAGDRRSNQGGARR